MPTLAIERRVKAPVEAVFAAASDLRNAPSRIPAIVRIEVLTDGPIRAGTRFRETRRMLGRDATEEMEIVSFDPPRAYVMGCDAHGCRYRSEWTFAPVPEGTLLKMTFDAQPLTLVAKVMSVLFAPMMKKMAAECGKDLDHLAAAVEREQAGR